MNTISFVAGRRFAGRTALIGSGAGSYRRKTRRSVPAASSRAQSQCGTCASPIPARAAARICSPVVRSEGAFGKMALVAALRREPPRSRAGLGGEDDAAMLLEIGRPPRLTVRVEVRRRRDDDDRRCTELSRDQARDGELAVADGDVDAILDEVRAAVGGVDLDAHVGVPPEELGETRHDVKGAEARGRADAHQPRGRSEATPDPGLGGVEIGDEPRCRLEEIASGLGERDLSRRSHQQLRTQMGLERRDLLADRRLSDPELTRDGREASALDDADEDPDGVESVHPRAGFYHSCPVQLHRLGGALPRPASEVGRRPAGGCASACRSRGRRRPSMRTGRAQSRLATAGRARGRSPRLTGSSEAQLTREQCEARWAGP